ncbi:hypothetical protein GJ496_000209 [Pomphorhynchus laevis]|nr:hypothetical protein GJ496_000205 [Pomphorhynchus laevis]KAI0981895.1 hypothetical protein GJ496_000209 [Pomphorhynchus laevis]
MPKPKVNSDFTIGLSSNRMVTRQSSKQQVCGSTAVTSLKAREKGKKKIANTVAGTLKNPQPSEVGQRNSSHSGSVDADSERATKNQSGQRKAMVGKRAASKKDANGSKAKESRKIDRKLVRRKMNKKHEKSEDEESMDSSSDQSDQGDDNEHIDENNLLTKCQNLLGTRCLYSALGINRKCSNDAVLRKAYYQTALKYHPDKHPNSKCKKTLEETFNVICQIYNILSNPDTKEIYDRTGNVTSDTLMSAECCRMFVNITTSDIDNYIKTYIGSDGEKEELINFYNKFHGDWNKISDNLISHSVTEEPRLKQIIADAITSGLVKDYGDEPASKSKRRIARLNNEREQVEKKIVSTKKSNLSDDCLNLVMTIQNRQSQRRNQLMERLNHLATVSDSEDDDSVENENENDDKLVQTPVKRRRGRQIKKDD